MTGSRVALRGHTRSCNLHVYSPLPSYSPQFSREKREPTRLERLARTRLHVPEEHAPTSPDRGGRDRYGPWVWISQGDCLWEWLALRPLMYTPLGEPFYRLHEHVHTEHDHPDRRDVVTPVKRALVRVLAAAGTRLDERWDTDVFSGRLPFTIKVRFPLLRPAQEVALRLQLPGRSIFTERAGYGGPQTHVSWTEHASSQLHARRQAQARARALGLLPGSAWDAPQKETP